MTFLRVNNMNRHEKESSIASLKEQFSKSQATFLVSYQGLTVMQLQKLRRALRAQGGEFQVAKTTLMKRAVQGMGCADTLTPYFKQQIGLVFVDKEMPAVAKVLKDFAQENEALGLVVGCADAALMTTDAIMRIASLPSRDVLLAQTCGTIKAPIVKLVCVLEALRQKRAEGSAA
jgi:large subunit ribosomal protein L10